MPEYSDIYVITEKRDRATVERFLRHFLPQRTESAEEYEIPQYSTTPEKVFKTDHELIEYCENNKEIEHSIYWQATGGKKPEHGMVFYLKDGYAIYGLSTDAENVVFAKNLLEELKEFINSNHGYIAHEASPDVNNYSDFLEQEKMHKP
jgi:hypothetical protein